MKNEIFPDLNIQEFEKYIISQNTNDEFFPNARMRFKFPNGYGASLIRGSYSYGGDAGLFELGVTAFNGEDEGSLTYDTPITNDVLGHLNPSDVINKLNQILALTKKEEDDMTNTSLSQLSTQQFDDLKQRVNEEILRRSAISVEQIFCAVPRDLWVKTKRGDFGRVYSIDVASQAIALADRSIGKEHLEAFYIGDPIKRTIKNEG